MTEYWRPSFGPEYKKKVEEFLERHPELPFKEPKEFMQFCTDKMITDVETSTEQLKRAQEQLEDLQKDLES